MDEHHGAEPARLPRNYRTVYAVLCDMPPGEHAPAGEIYVAARQRQPTIGYSTVYRALERLTALGLVAEVRVPGAQSALYERVRDQHAHFVCDSCGSIQDVDFELMPAEVDAMATRVNVTVTHAELVFKGFCRTCAGRTLAS